MHKCNEWRDEAINRFEDMTVDTGLICRKRSVDVSAIDTKAKCDAVRFTFSKDLETVVAFTVWFYAHGMLVLEFLVGGISKPPAKVMRSLAKDLDSTYVCYEKGGDLKRLFAFVQAHIKKKEA